MKFGRMMYFDDLIKDLWFVIGFFQKSVAMATKCHFSSFFDFSEM